MTSTYGASPFGKVPMRREGVTRVRIEARGPTPDKVRAYLIEMAESISVDDVWECDEDKDLQIQTAKDGYWGFMIIRRVSG